MCNSTNYCDTIIGPTKSSNESSTRTRPTCYWSIFKGCPRLAESSSKRKGTPEGRSHPFVLTQAPFFIAPLGSLARRRYHTSPPRTFVEDFDKLGTALCPRLGSFKPFVVVLTSFSPDFHDFGDKREKTNSEISLNMKGKKALLSCSFPVPFLLPFSSFLSRHM